MSKKGVLLINLGTPENLSPASVRKYLKQFLNDPRVVDLPALVRWFLVNWVIVPFRYKKTFAAYKKIWTPTGSPLWVLSEQMKEALSLGLGSDYQVEIGMRYGNPSISAAYKKLNTVSSLTVIPLFPQYSSAATGSALEVILKELSHRWNMPEIKMVNDFYNHPGFIHAFTEQIRKSILNKKIDKLIFSYHGLPERHLDKSICEADCDRVNECPIIQASNRFCYRAQCYATTQRIARELGLASKEYVVSFQSRLGRTPWIKPYTDVLLPELIQQGVRNIAMVSPSFVVDCLETLEEINIRTREQWHALGGKEFIFVPCINAETTWIEALIKMIK
jgi:ferrochelatase